MLIEQNAALRENLKQAHAQLRALRLEQLAARTRDGLAALPACDIELDDLRKQRDAALATIQRAEAELVALRNLNQRLMVQNSRLLRAAAESGHP